VPDDLPDGRRNLLEFEVRHWIANNEAGIGRGRLTTGIKRLLSHHDTLGNIFYGAGGYPATAEVVTASARSGTDSRLMCSSTAPAHQMPGRPVMSSVRKHCDPASWAWSSCFPWGDTESRYVNRSGVRGRSTTLETRRVAKSRYVRRKHVIHDMNRLSTVY